jgi:hypothetical protein
MIRIKTIAKSATKSTLTFFRCFDAVQHSKHASDNDCKKHPRANETGEPICRPWSCESFGMSHGVESNVIRLTSNRRAASDAGPRLGWSAADVKSSVRGLDVIPLALQTRIKSKCALRRFYSRGTGRFIWIVVGSTARLWAVAIVPGSVRSSRLLCRQVVSR